MGLHDLQENIDKTGSRALLLPTIFIVVSALFLLFGEPGREWLRYDRIWIGQGEFWRLLSGHFAHLGWKHFALNGSGLILVWFLVGRNLDSRGWVLVTLVTLAVMDASFWVLNPELLWYVGMSGMLHGLLVAGIVARIPNVDAESGVLLLLLVAKIAWEQTAGPVPGSELSSGGPVVVDAHLYGALGGAVGAVLARIRVTLRSSI